MAVVLLVVALLAVHFLRPRLPAPDWSLRLAADPLPEEIDTAAKRDAWVNAHGRLLSGATLEKVMLVGLVSVIYGQVLPDVHTSSTRLFLGITAFVVVNGALSLAVSRRFRSVDSAILAFGVRVVVNVVLVLLYGWLLRRDGDSLDITDTLFFVGLVSLLTLLDDRFGRWPASGSPAPGRPVGATGDQRRRTTSKSPPAGNTGSPGVLPGAGAGQPPCHRLRSPPTARYTRAVVTASTIVPTDSTTRVGRTGP